MSIDWGRPVRTKSGAPVEIITVKGRGLGCVVGFVGEEELPYRWARDGHCMTHTQASTSYAHEGHGYDLVNVPQPVQTREVWITLYESRDGLGIYTVHDRKTYEVVHDEKNGIKILGRNKIILRAEFDE